MREKTLAESKLFAANEVTKLNQLGVYTSRDFIEHFYLPEQHKLLAAFLGRDIDEVKDLVDFFGKQFPTEELNELVEEAQKSRTFGVLPPNQFGELNHE